MKKIQIRRPALVGFGVIATQLTASIVAGHYAGRAVRSAINPQTPSQEVGALVAGGIAGYAAGVLAVQAVNVVAGYAVHTTCEFPEDDAIVEPIIEMNQN